MTEISQLQSFVSDDTKRNLKRKRNKRIKNKHIAFESNRLTFSCWENSVTDDDPLALFTKGVEGGFISLEEIDGSNYNSLGDKRDIGSTTKSKKEKKCSNLNKLIKGKNNADSKSDCFSTVRGKKEKNDSKKKKKKRRIDHYKTLSTDREQEYEHTEGIHENAMDAWNEMRLHPLLIQSIQRLGFFEPTPIQKACIPVASHQGKDVIGAAQTGSGKTLAFGLPILQRILEERQKEKRLQQNDIEDACCFGGHLRALILAPTRELALQVSNHLKKAAKGINVLVVSIVGGMYSEKQERLLRRRPEIVVGTPGRLWELMSGGNDHLVELDSLSFFVLDEADRMIENGHFDELQSIIDMLPSANGSIERTFKDDRVCETISNLSKRKRQTFVFSATIALSDNFRKKLKRTSFTAKSAMENGLTSIEKLSEQAGIKPDVAIVDLTTTSIMADNLVESFAECSEEEKDAYLYYILSVHRKGRAIVFCTSISALRHISSLLQVLGIIVWTLHAQMQQRARLKAMDRFCNSEHGVLIATDVAARGLDVPGIRTVVHYQLPHSAEVYIHRSGRTARASSNGCSIALISSNDKAKFSSLCKSLSKESLQEFFVDSAYMPDVMKRVHLARQIDKLQRQGSQENAKKSWLERNAMNAELLVDDSDNEEERVMGYKQKKTSLFQLKKLQQELDALLSKPLQPRTFSHQYFAGAGVSTLVQKQLEEFSKAKLAMKMGSHNQKTHGLVVIGQDCVEPLEALRNSGREVCVNSDKKRDARRMVEKWKQTKRREEE